MNRIASLVLAASKRFNPAVAIESHQVMAKALKLVVVGQLFKAVDDWVGSHARYTSSADTTTENGTPSVSKCFWPQRTLSASLVRSFKKSLVLFVSRARYRVSSSG